MREGEGGSGGREYALIAVRPLEASHLVMSVFAQSETIPRFDAAWAVLEHTTLKQVAATCYLSALMMTCA